MDLGDWQELSRLRFENHLWHRCVDEIRAEVERPAATTNSIAHVVERSIEVLNKGLAGLHRRPVGRGAQAGRR
jgi:hypothetical protein